jgi:hypothetical protein
MRPKPLTNAERQARRRAKRNALAYKRCWTRRASPGTCARPARATLSDGGAGVMSMVPATGIGRSCGTSMVTPAVTGVVALMVEKMGKLGFDKSNVFPSTYKAFLIHGAEDLGRPGPDFEFGFGHVRVASTLKLMSDRAFHQLKIEREGDVQTQELPIASGASELKVTLVWDDRPVSIFSNEALSNDLDLVLVSPSGDRQLPFLLDGAHGRETEPARPGVDRVNVVEQVLIKQPNAGVWRVEVRASKIGSPTGGQTYSLVTSVQ